MAEGWGNYAVNYAKEEKEAMMGYYSQLATNILFNNTQRGEKVNFLDVAAGPAVLTLRVGEALHTKDVDKAVSTITVTDFASTMVELANKRIQASQTLQSLGILIQVRMMDACAPDLPEHSVTHLGCMFGIMFFEQRAQALECLRRLLSPGGTALFSTWQHSDYLDILGDFGHFVHVPNELIEQEVHAPPLSIDHDSEELYSDLQVAGYSNIEIMQEEKSFQFTNNQDFFDTLLCNPILSKMFPFLVQRNRSDLLNQWHTFLHSEKGRKWVTEDNEKLVMRFVANIAVCSA
ncbi:class I SAM-dependent methyltransferase [archaeon]|nr:MAG: class I SAM-dependent methyltransferase [archaeon]